MFALKGHAVRNNLVLEDYESSLGETLSATAEETWITSPMTAISRFMSLNQAKPERYEPGMVGGYEPSKAFVSWNSLDQAKQKIDQAGVDLDIPEQGISQEKLDILIERKRAEVKRQSVLARGPQGILPGAAKLGTALAVSLADPLNIATAFVPVVSAARMAQLSTRLGKTGGRLTTGAVEGTVGAALVEPIVYGAMQAEQADYTLYDSYLNLTVGAVLGGGLHAGLGKLSDIIDQRSAQTRVDLLQAATGQALDNRPIDVTQVADAAGIEYPSPLPTAKAKVSTRTGDYGEMITLESANGKLTASMEGDSITVGTVKVSEGSRGKGEGTGLYSDLIAEAQLRGVNKLNSDNIVMPDAYRVWGSLERRGVKVTKDPNAKFIKDDKGGFWTVDDDSRPVFTADIKKQRSTLYENTTPKHSPQADPKSSAAATERLNKAPQSTPEAVDQLTNDVILALDEQGIDTADLKAEVAEINTQIERAAKGLREAVLCRIG